MTQLSADAASGCVVSHPDRAHPIWQTATASMGHEGKFYVELEIVP
jgi:hypothetical protein